MAGTSLRRVLLGTPIPSHQAAHHRLPKFLALPVFASDAISSSCYATEEILLVLNRYLVPLVGVAALGYALPIALGIAALLAVVTISYRQTVMAYPGGGGAYIVARENLGEAPAQIAGAALLTDYVLTVSVSIAAGVAAIDSALPALLPYRVWLCVGFVAVMTVINLRGVRESGWAAAVPSYTYVAVMLLMLAMGGVRLLVHGISPVPAGSPEAAPHAASLSSLAFVFILMHAFANGCAAITGTEAISNGVMAFRPPEGRNAATTMVLMSLILATLFLGLTGLARAFRIVAVEHETVLSQVGRIVFGGGPLYYLLQAATCAILVLAANTAFADFPRLANLHASDGFLPRQLTHLGDRLVFQNGIIALAAVASLLIIVFGGVVDRLIPLYAIGVFLSFTMSQTGMVRRWFRLREAGWRVKALVSGLGAVSCAAVTIIFATTKFVHGAWIVVITVPLMVWCFFRVHRHYKGIAKQLSLDEAAPVAAPLRQKALLLISGVQRATLAALAYARTISDDVEALYVELTPGAADEVREKWGVWGQGVPLRIAESPHRELLAPIMNHIDSLLEDESLDLLTVVVPEFVVRHWIHNALHNQTGLRLRLALLHKPRVIVTTVPFQLQ
jgi:amino acid transporter